MGFVRLSEGGRTHNRLNDAQRSCDLFLSFFVFTPY